MEESRWRQERQHDSILGRRGLKNSSIVQHKLEDGPRKVSTHMISNLHTCAMNKQSIHASHIRAIIVTNHIASIHLTIIELAIYVSVYHVC